MLSRLLPLETRAQTARRRPNGVRVHDGMILAVTDLRLIGHRLALRNYVAVPVVETSHQQKERNRMDLAKEQ